jgi:RNA polymerase sigma factor (sigma-70 family)
MGSSSNGKINQAGGRAYGAGPTSVTSVGLTRKPSKLFAPISREEELTLARRFKYCSRNPALREECRRKLVHANMGMIWRFAWQLSSRWPTADIEDLVQVGAMHLHESIPRFNPARGVRLMGFCGRLVQFKMWAEACRGVIKVPHQSARRQTEQANNAMNVASIDQLRETDGYGEAGQLDIALAWKQPEALEELAEVERLEEIERLAGRALSALETRERMVMEMRVRGATLKEVGSYLGICKERVRQIEEVAVRKMREELGAG